MGLLQPHGRPDGSGGEAEVTLGVWLLVLTLAASLKRGSQFSKIGLLRMHKKEGKMRLMCALVAAVVLCAGLKAEEAAAGGAPAWMEKFLLGKEHEALKKLAGSYEVT